MPSALRDLQLTELGHRLHTLASQEFERQNAEDFPDEDYDIWGNDPAVKAEVIRIGEIANELGGFAFMQRLCYSTFTERSKPPMDVLTDRVCPDRMSQHALGGLNYAWNGIGDWQA